VSGSCRQNADKARAAYVNDLSERGVQLTLIADQREVAYRTGAGKKLSVFRSRMKRQSQTLGGGGFLMQPTSIS
jgi:hypothetical protein